MKNSDFQNKSRVRDVIYVRLVSHYITNSAIILNVDWRFCKIARRVEKGNDVRSGAMRGCELTFLARNVVYITSENKRNKKKNNKQHFVFF